MKFTIGKNLLLENLSNVVKAISTKNIIPILNGVKFELETRIDSTRSGTPLYLFEARTPYEVYLSGINEQELLNLIDKQESLDRYCGLKVGDVEEPNNNAGNWE